MMTTWHELGEFDLEEYRKWLAVFIYRSDPIDATNALGRALDEIERLRAKVAKLDKVAKAAKAAIEDWYFDGSYKDLRRAIDAFEETHDR